ncbi:MAG: diaminopimelate epimerase [Synergistaceae bacterium]
MINAVKMNGNGNDFLVINNMDKKYSSNDLSEMAIKLCRRRESIGGDGILVLEPSLLCAFKMRLFNSDGSEGEMCGNGARCTARFALENGIVEKNEMVFETLGGDVRAVVNGQRVTLKLAPVILDNIVVDSPICVCGEEFHYTFITVGVPHAVIFEEERSRTDDGYRTLGRAVRSRTDLFPDGTNVNFVVPRESLDGELDVLTYERGVEDLTLSCGTGSTASAIASVLIGITGPKVDVWNPGGLNRVTLVFEGSDKVLPELEGSVLNIASLSITEEAMR